MYTSKHYTLFELLNLFCTQLAARLGDEERLDRAKVARHKREEVRRLRDGVLPNGVLPNPTQQQQQQQSTAMAELNALRN